MIIPKTQVLLLGSFHFLEGQEVDIYSDKAQAELRTLIGSLARFNPDIVAVEAPYEAQSAITHSYEQVSLDDFSDIEKMKTSQLGFIEFCGEKFPITYMTEGIQIGFRLAKTLEKDNVYAVDYCDAWFDDTIYGTMSSLFPWWRDETKRFHENEGAVTSCGSILNNLRFFNQAEYGRKIHYLFYLLPNSIGAGSDFVGSVFLSKWYDRNIKIFANIQKLALESKRLFVLYGAGHLPILKSLIEASDNMELVNTLDYL